MVEKEYGSPNYFASRLRDSLTYILITSVGGSVEGKHGGRDGEFVTFSIAKLDCKVRFEYRSGEPWVVHEFLDEEGAAKKSYEKRFSPKRSSSGRISVYSMDKALSGFLTNNLRKYGKSLRGH